MSKIIKNGIVYGETLLPAAGNIVYDNTASGLNATTMQNAITELKDMYDLPKGYAWAGTQAQWDALTAQEKAIYDGKIIAIIDDDSVPADNVVYDNTDSGLTSDNVQDAIDELKGLADDATTQVTALPVASAENVNKIYQYTGATTNTYINGYFYKCVNDNGTYKWTEVTVQNEVGQKDKTGGGGEIFNTYSGQGYNHAYGIASHSEGSNNSAVGDYSHTEGFGSTSQGDYSHAEGYITNASGIASHAEGSNTTANAENAHAEGQLTAVYSDAGHAEGKYTVVGSAVVDPETGETTYTGTGATFGHAEGYTSHAAGYTSHAEGSGTLATGVVSHAEGYATQARGDGSHSEGYATIAAGGNSHAEGHTTFAQGLNSHASGHHTRANTANSTVIGRYNIADGTEENDPKHLFIVGNGVDDNSRSNIVEVSDTYLNLNGVFKQNGQVIDFSTLGDEIIKMSDIEYNVLVTKDPDKVYFVYETEINNRMIIVKNSNGDFVYSAAIYGVATTGTPGTNNFATDSDAPTTPPTKVAPQPSGTSLMFSYTTTEKTVYFNHFSYYAPNAGGRATDSDASNCYFTISGSDNNQYSIVTAYDTLAGPFVALSTGDYVEFATVPKPNGFRRIYKGDELYATPNEYIKDAEINSSTGSLTLTKQDNTTVVLTMDSTPASGSANAVTSDGIYQVTPFERGTGDNSAQKGDCQATGTNSFATGNNSKAQNPSTSAMGGNVIADQNFMTSIGKFNQSRSGDLFNIGNGTGNNNRSNIVEVNSTELNVNGDIKKNGVSIFPLVYDAQTESFVFGGVSNG